MGEVGARSGNSHPRCRSGDLPDQLRSLEGIQILQSAAAKQGEALGQEPGIRICVFIVDQETFVFSPTPRQLEAPPGESSPVTPATPSPPKANGIVLSRPPESLAAELGSGDEGITQRKLGLEPLSKEKLKGVTEDLAKNPPKNFDLARAVNVYNARVQFVEFKLGGCKLSEHKAQLPKHLIYVLKKNPALSRKIENSIRLLDNEDGLVTDKTLSQETLFTHREDSREIPPSGERRGNRDRAREEGRVLQGHQSLKAEVEKFAKSVEAKLAERFSRPRSNSPTRSSTKCSRTCPNGGGKSWLAPRPQRVRWYVLEDLLKAFGTPAGKVGKMKVETVFKDVTYDMLNESEFREQMAEYFPDLPLMEEFKAAKERPAAAKGAQQELLP